MKSLTTSLIFGILACSQVFAQKGIYDKDNRQEVDRLPAEYSSLASASVTLMEAERLGPEKSGLVPITAPSMMEKGLCRNERFANQPSAGFCSGCLVGPSEILTAGHCADECSTTRVVFGFKGEGNSVSANNVYKCSKVLVVSNKGVGRDFAILKLDREVQDRRPASWRRSGYPPRGTPLLMIGSPTGMPLKSATGTIRYIDNSTALGSVISTDLDAFGGNSGSCVFNKSNNLIEGVLTHGEEDYVADNARGCIRPSPTMLRTYDKYNGEILTPVSVIRTVLERHVRPASSTSIIPNSNNTTK